MPFIFPINARLTAAAFYDELDYLSSVVFPSVVILNKDEKPRFFQLPSLEMVKCGNGFFCCEFSSLSSSTALRINVQKIIARTAFDVV